ncbi:uncharacterized protein LOC133910754 [Phragmites australis]|uniref:uncharacterized protein LOC133910754 n=1 Tax=Phragmites australis TaxID=29695 RepID=UPI002D772A7D|nr:uncharacterized protein LOC133910754 [Phragmites australis]
MDETDVAEQAATTSRDWDGLPGDLLTCIGGLLGLPARLCFRGVCRSWSAALALPAMPSPWLVIPDGWNICDRDRFSFHSLPTRSPMRWTLQGERCIGSSGGWLALVDAGLSITLLNPLTDAQQAVRLPPLGPLRRDGIFAYTPMSPDGTLQLRTQKDKILFSRAQNCLVQRVAFAPNPTAQDYAVAVLCRDDQGLAFTTASSNGWQWLDWPVAAGRAAPQDGDEEEVEVDAVYVNCDLDLVYHGGKFYYMTLCGQIWALDPAAPSPVAPVPFAKWRPPGPDHYHYGKHLVFTDDGALHVVWSDVPGLSDATCARPMRMHVKRYEPSRRARRWRKVRHLGGSAFLIGNRNHSVAVPVPASSPSTWLRPNCVYFTDLAPGSDNFKDRDEYVDPGEIWEFDVETGSFRACDLGGLDWFDWHKAIWFTPRGGGNPITDRIVSFAQLFPHLICK